MSKKRVLLCAFYYSENKPTEQNKERPWLGIWVLEAPLANWLLSLFSMVSLRGTDAPQVSFIGYPGFVGSLHSAPVGWAHVRLSQLFDNPALMISALQDCPLLLCKLHTESKENLSTRVPFKYFHLLNFRSFNLLPLFLNIKVFFNCKGKRKQKLATNAHWEISQPVRMKINSAVEGGVSPKPEDHPAISWRSRRWGKKSYQKK